MEIFTSRETVEDNENKGENCVRKFSWDEIERLTNNFSKVIGSGGYSTVYLAQSPDSGHGFWAIKIHNGSERLNRVFKQELDILLRLGHQSIVKLLGYCDDRGEYLSTFVIFFKFFSLRIQNSNRNLNYSVFILRNRGGCSGF